MERKSNGHTETLKCCPHCEQIYVVQHGGQKSGGSPAVRVEGSGGPATGFCSTRCEVESGGGSLEGIKEWFEKTTGNKYEDVFPPGYLAPARIPSGLVQVARIRNLQERVAKQNGRR